MRGVRGVAADVEPAVVAMMHRRALSPLRDDDADGMDDEFAAFQAELATACDGDGVDVADVARRESFVDDDGTPYVWDALLERFVEDARGQAASVAASVSYDESVMTYSANDDDAREVQRAAEVFDAINAEAKAMETEDERDARKREVALERARAKAKRAKVSRDESVKILSNKNTSVYITGLPRDVTEEEIAETFKKCGVIKVDARDGSSRVKVYRDDDGQVKGDALVVFLKGPSVDLAITLLDQSELRAGDASTKMTVSAAKFEMKQSDKKDGKMAASDADAPGVAKPKKLTKEERKRAAVILKRQEAAALGWDGFDDVVDLKKVIVVLKHMFTLEEMYADVNLRKELEEDVMEEAQKCGHVLSIKTYTTTKDGVMTLRFKLPEGAESCLREWNGRWFAGRQIEASLWDGRTKLGKEEESEAAQKARLDAYAAELAGGVDADASDDDNASDASEDDGAREEQEQE